MKLNKKIVFITIVFLFFQMASSCKSNGNVFKYKGSDYKNGDEIKVTGKIVSIGAEPFVDKIIIDENDERFFLDESLVPELKEHKGGMVTIWGIIKLETIETVDGKHSFLKKTIMPE